MSTDRGRPARHVLPLAITPLLDGDLSAYFEGLANPTRLRIVEQLATVKEARVSDVALLLGISQPRMSWHLRLLRRARIVQTRREGREVFCRLDREAIAANLESFSRLLADGEAPRPQSKQTPDAAPAESVKPSLPGASRERTFPEVV